MENLHPLLNEICLRLEIIEKKLESNITSTKTELNAQEAADFLGIKIKTLYQYNHKKLIKYNKPLKFIEYNVEELKKFKSRNEIVSNDELKKSINPKKRRHGK